MTIQDGLARLLEGHDLSREDAREVMGEIMSGKATPAQIGGFLIALRLKGETADEIAGCAEAMRAHVLAVSPKRDDLVDTAGTGGDGAGTFNISTAAALVAAAAGAGVAKHGNRAVSSSSGSADVLEALGFDLEQPAERIERSIDELGCIDADHLGPGARGVGERAEDVEDRAGSQLAAYGSRVAHGRMVRGREEEAEAELVDGALDAFSWLLEVEAESLEHVGRPRG